MSRRVTRQPRARRDIVEQADFIGRDNPEAAERFLEAVERAERLLGDMPDMGAPRSFPGLSGIRMWRVRGFERHLIFYRVLDDGVEVLRVLHASRDIRRLLDE